MIGGGFIGSNSIKVGEDLFLQGIPASLDLIFTEPNHTGVGFKLSRFAGFPTGGWHITVYNKADEVIGKFDVPAPGANEPFKEFFGVWCFQSIGRINIYDEAGIAPDAIDPGGKNCFPGPLGPFPSKNFPNGLSETNILVQDNITPGPNPPAPNPSGDPCALYAIGPGFIGSNSIKVGEDLFLQNIPASLDLIFTEPNHTGIGFRLSRFDGFPTGGWHISVYDKGDVPLGQFDVPAPGGNEPFKEFVGVWCFPTIGRINIYDQAGIAPDAVDDIQMWQEAPTPARATTWGGLKVIYR